MGDLEKLKKRREKMLAEATKTGYYIRQLETVKRLIDDLPGIAKKTLPFDQGTSRQITSLEVIARDLRSMITDAQDVLYVKQHSIEDIDNKIKLTEGESE